MAERRFSRTPGPSADVGQANMKAAGIFDRVSSSFGQKAQQIAIEKAEEEGAEEAVRNPGVTRKQAITKADKAFNDSYLDASRVIISSEAQREISQLAHDQISEGALGPDSLSRFNQMGRETIRGILENTPRQNRAQIEIAANNYFKQSQQKVSRAVQDYNRALMLGEMKSSVSGFLDGATNAYLDGDRSGGEFLSREAMLSIDLASKSGLIQKEEAENLRNSIKMQSYKALYRGELRKAFNLGNSAEFLSRFSSKRPEHLTATEQQEIGAALLQEQRYLNQMQAEQNALNFFDAAEKIQSGEIYDTSQIDALRSSVSNSEYIKLKAALSSKQQKELQSQENIEAIWTGALNNNYNVIAASSSAELNKAFEYGLNLKRNEKKQALMAIGEATEEQPLPVASLKEQSQVVSNMNGANITDFNSRLSAAIKVPSSNAAKVEAIDAYKYLSSENPSYLRNLSDETRADLQLLSSLSESAMSMQDKDYLEAAIEQFKRYKDISPNVRSEREEKYKELTKKKSIDDYALELAKGIGANSLFSRKKTVLDRIPPGIAEQYRQLVKSYYMTYGSEEEAKAIAQKKVEMSYGPDTLSGGNMFTFMPPSKVIPDFEKNKTFYRNDLIKSVIESVEAFNNAPEELRNYSSLEFVDSQKIEMERLQRVGPTAQLQQRKDASKPISEFSEYEMLYTPYFKDNEPIRVKINGEEAQISLVGTPGLVTAESPFDSQWSIYIDDGSGVLQMFSPLVGMQELYAPEDISQYSWGSAKRNAEMEFEANEIKQRKIRAREQLNNFWFNENQSSGALISMNQSPAKFNSPDPTMVF